MQCLRLVKFRTNPLSSQFSPGTLSTPLGGCLPPSSIPCDAKMNTRRFDQPRCQKIICLGSSDDVHVFRMRKYLNETDSSAVIWQSRRVEKRSSPSHQTWGVQHPDLNGYFHSQSQFLTRRRHRGLVYFWTTASKAQNQGWLNIDIRDKHRHEPLSRIEEHEAMRYQQQCDTSGESMTNRSNHVLELRS